MKVATIEAPAASAVPPVAAATVTETEIRGGVLNPRQELADLEKAAFERGMPMEKLAEIQEIGECDSQIMVRIRRLNEWLASRP